MGVVPHLILPAVTVGVVSGSVLTRFVRSSATEALGQDYTRTADAKYLPARLVLRRHVLRNALVPVVTVAGIQLAYLLSGWSSSRWSSPGRASACSPSRR